MLTQYRGNGNEGGFTYEGSTTLSADCRCSRGRCCRPNSARLSDHISNNARHRRLYFPNIEIRLGAAALLAVLLQVIAIFAPLGGDDWPRRVLFIVSYLLLFAFVAANIRRTGIAILGAGLLLNFLAIAANGGLMPVTEETLLKTGSLPDDAEVGEWVPQTKDVLLEREDVRLYFLSDRLVIEALDPLRAFSVGDVIIVIGLIVTIGDLLLPRMTPRYDKTVKNGA